jgi:eukaryotic-like serine/threonine-protein kinase
MNLSRKSDGKQKQPRANSDSGSDNITVRGDERSAGPDDPGATVIGSSDQTHENVSPVLRESDQTKRPAAEAMAGRDATQVVPEDANQDEANDSACQQTLIPSAGENTDSSDVEDDESFQATFVSHVDNAGEDGQTFVPPAGEKKNSEDFFETLVEDADERDRTGRDVAGLVIGDYQVQRELGRGAMGVVYQARHRKLERIVALKMILAGEHADHDALERFITEARAVAQLQHPGIVQIFDIGDHKGLPYFSLEFVDGKDLQRDLNGEPRGGRAAAELVEQLCLAMQYAHDNKILHRDLKPANILIGTDGRPKITDFGLAKQVDPDASAATSDGTIMGSPSYMPPEQARGETSSISPRSDLYSLGAVLYQMLTGRPPFVSDRPLDTVMQVIQNDPVQPRDLQPGVPIDLETICMKALQKDSAARYHSCQEFADDLRRFLNHEPILARPVSRLERMWRWCRRNPKIALPTGVASLFVIATAIISTWAWNATSAQAAIIARERDNVKEQRDEAQRQRTLANQQKAVAEDNEKIAQKQAQLALQNIQFIVTDIDEQLSAQAGMSDIRIAILEAVSKKWDDLDVEMAGGIRGEAIPTFMAVRHRMAIAFRDLDQLGNARAEFTKLETMARERIALKGRNDATRSNLAKILIAASPMARRVDGNPNACIRMLKEAAELAREIIRDPQPQEDSPTENEILQVLGAATQNLGVEFLREGRLADTGSAFEDSLNANLAVLENIRSEDGFAELNEDQKDTKTAALQIALDKSRIGLAYILLRLGRTEESLVLYEEAIASRREIYERRQTMLMLKAELAGHLNLYGKSLLWIDRPEDAEARIREGRDLWDQLYQADPEKVAYKRSLSNSLYFLGTLREIQERDDESLSAFERSRLLRAELNETSSDQKNRIHLMLAEARVGNIAAAQTLSDELRKTDESNSELHLERARALTQLSNKAETEEQQSGFTDAALAALERSVEEGYSDPFRVTAEPDLDPLHEHDRFKRVVAELQERRDEQQSEGD